MPPKIPSSIVTDYYDGGLINIDLSKAFASADLALLLSSFAEILDFAVPKTTDLTILVPKTYNSFVSGIALMIINSFWDKLRKNKNEI